jgi:AraC-like DNA-binding protein
MKSGRDIAVQFPGLFVVHHNKPGQHTAAHAHDDHHLIVPLRGEARLLVNGEEWSFGPGRMAYLPAQCEHEFLSTNTKEGERLIALIDPKLWKRAQGPLMGALLLPAQQLCKELLFQLILSPKSRSVPELCLCFASVLGEAIESGAALGTTDSMESLLARARDLRVRKAATKLQEQFRDDLKMDALAKASGLSARNFTRLFAQELGIGPKQVLIRLRLEEARRLLSEESLSVTDTCYRVGYQSLSRFIQSYRETFGRLPSEESRQI